MARLLSAWRVITLQVKDPKATEYQSVPMSAFAQAYHGSPDTKDALDMRKAMVRGSLQYLEEQYVRSCFTHSSVLS